jgi:hypothetical protein
MSRFLVAMNAKKVFKTCFVITSPTACEEHSLASQLQKTASEFRDKRLFCFGWFARIGDISKTIRRHYQLILAAP